MSWLLHTKLLFLETIWGTLQDRSFHGLCQIIYRCLQSDGRRVLRLSELLILYKGKALATGKSVYHGHLKSSGKPERASEEATIKLRPKNEFGSARWRRGGTIFQENDRGCGTCKGPEAGRKNFETFSFNCLSIPWAPRFCWYISFLLKLAEIPLLSTKGVYTSNFRQEFLATVCTLFSQSHQPEPQILTSWTHWPVPVLMDMWVHLASPRKVKRVFLCATKYWKASDFLFSSCWFFRGSRWHDPKHADLTWSLSAALLAPITSSHPCVWGNHTAQP